MDNKQKLIDDTFKLLLIFTASAWAIYIAFLLLVGQNESCSVDPPGRFITFFALLAGLLTAPPLLYGLGRFLFWPTGQKSRYTWIGGWILAFGAGIFIVLASLFALALSQYGCQ